MIFLCFVAFRFIAELAFGSQYSDLFLNLQQSLMAFNQTLKSLILYFFTNPRHDAFQQNACCAAPLHTSIDCKTACLMSFRRHASTVKKFKIATAL
jgi:hypothetical protein